MENGSTCSFDKESQRDNDIQRNFGRRKLVLMMFSTYLN